MPIVLIAGDFLQTKPAYDVSLADDVDDLKAAERNIHPEPSSAQEALLTVEDVIHLKSSKRFLDEAMPSLMPAGLADQLKTREEFIDLAKFVSVLGKPGPYANDESPVIRKWMVAASEAGAPGENESWRSVYSLVNGILPNDEMGDKKVSFARGFVEVQAAGPVRLKINELAGVRLWVDDKEIKDPSSTFNLRTGTRSFTFSIDRVKRKSGGLRVELIPAANSGAKFQPKGGV